MNGMVGFDASWARCGLWASPRELENRVAAVTHALRATCFRNWSIMDSTRPIHQTGGVLPHWRGPLKNTIEVIEKKWNMVVSPDNPTSAQKSIQTSSSHFMMLWKGVSWVHLASCQ